MAKNSSSREGGAVGEAEDTGPASGDFEANIDSQWGRQGVEAPDGVALSADGGINVDRFSIGPETELSVPWWNKRVTWQVRREPSAHEVVVARVTENIWRVHLMVAAGAIGLGVLGLMAFGGLSPLWGVLLAVLLCVAAYGALRIEQRTGESRVGIEEVYVLDSVLWNGACKKARTDILTKTKAGQKALYDEAVKYYREKYETVYGDPDTGKVGKSWVNPKTKRIEPVPKFSVSDEMKANLLSETGRITADSAVDQIGMLLSLSGQARASQRLRQSYLDKPIRAENKGRGVRGCTCVACSVNAERGVTPALFGAEAARRVEIQRAKEAAAKAARTGEEVVDTGSMRAVMLDVANKMRTGHSAPAQVYDPESEDLVSTKAIKAQSKLAATKRNKDAAAEQEDEKTQAIDAKAQLARERKEVKARVKARRKEQGRKFNPVPWLVGGGVALVVLVMVVAIVLGTKGQSDAPIAKDPTSTVSTPATTSEQSTPSTPAPPPVPAGEEVGKPLRFGPTDRGNQLGGAGVIAAYEYNYYAEPRNAEAAQSLYAPGARGSLVDLRNAMESNPSGTTYELTVTPVVLGKEYAVRLKVIWPGRGDTTVDQKFFTTYNDGKFFILRAE